MAEEQDTENIDGGESFAEMLEKSLVKREKLQPGQVVEAKIVKISSEWAFLDLGGKGEGTLDRKELVDESGALKVNEGDRIRVYFLSSGENEMRFTTRVAAGPGGKSQLEDAYKGRIPVDGTVVKEVKGGFEVRIGGGRAFCPYSQMGLARTDAAASVVGKQLSFMITEYGERGRNVVVSRRPILEEERRTKLQALRESLKEGMLVKGTVTSLQEFGAFVNIGGVEGLLPVSEIAWSRVNNIRDVLSPGQQVEVIIKRIDWEKERFSFSLKDTLADPWQGVAERFPAGSFHTGTVSRLAPFGAFVTMADGLDGLIHISRLGGGKRISHPREVLKEGQTVEVKVESADAANRKLSLALADVSREEEEAAATLKDFQKKQGDTPASMGSLGELLKQQMERNKPQ